MTILLFCGTCRYRLSQNPSDQEKPSDSGSDQSNSANIEDIAAAVEALDDDELAVRVAAVDEDAALDLMQQQEECVGLLLFKFLSTIM